MQGMPQWLNSKQDYINIIIESQAGRLPVGEVRTALHRLAASVDALVNVAEYPPDYGTPAYDGPPIAPVWEQRPAPNGHLYQLGLTVAEVEALLEEILHDE